MSRKKKTALPSILRAPRTQADYVLTQPSVPPPVFQSSQYTAGIPESFEVRVQVLSDPHATVARAVFAEAGTWQPVYTATGSARTEPGDVYDPEIGTALAVSRALQNLGRQIGRQAGGLVRHAESNKKNKPSPEPGQKLAGFVDVDTGTREVFIHMPEGSDEADVPGEIRDLIGQMFPDSTVRFVSDGTSSLPDDIVRAMEAVVNSEPGRKPGRHARGEGDNAPVDPDLLNHRG